MPKEKTSKSDLETHLINFLAIATSKGGRREIEKVFGRKRTTVVLSTAELLSAFLEGLPALDAKHLELD
jgi:hypothetical protein